MYKTSSLLWFSQIAGMIMALVSSILVSRYLGPENRGIFTMTFLIPSLIAQFMCFGLGTSGVFYLRSNTDRKDTYFTALLLLTLIASATGIFAVLALGYFNPQFLKDINLTFCFFFTVILIIQGNLVPVLLSLSSINFYVTYQVANQAVVTALVSSVAVLTEDLNSTLISNLTASIIAVISLMILLLRTFSITALSLNPIKHLISYGFRMVISDVLDLTYRRASSVVIAQRFDMHSLGIYSGAFGIVERLWTITDAIGTAILVRITDTANSARFSLLLRTLGVVSIILFPIFAALWILADQIILILFGEAFRDSIELFKYLIIAIFFDGIRRIIQGYFKGTGAGKVLIISNLIATLLIVISFACITFDNIASIVKIHIFVSIFSLLACLFLAHRTKENKR